MGFLFEFQFGSWDFIFLVFLSEYPESKWAMDGGVSGRLLEEIK